jgi:hypothetical protein
VAWAAGVGEELGGVVEEEMRVEVVEKVVVEVAEEVVEEVLSVTQRFNTKNVGEVSEGVR